MRRFNVVLVGDDHLRSCLDAVRIIANPSERHTSHITVGGPFTTPSRADFGQNGVAGTKIDVVGVGRFSGGEQNTVFLSCDSPRLRKIWRKRDFGYNPHITIYDGPSTTFARRLYAYAQGLNLHFAFRAGEVISLFSRRAQVDGDLMISLDTRLVNKLLRTRLSPDDVYTMGVRRRWNLTSGLLLHIANWYSHRSGTFWRESYFIS